MVGREFLIGEDRGTDYQSWPFSRKCASNHFIDFTRLYKLKSCVKAAGLPSCVDFSLGMINVLAGHMSFWALDNGLEKPVTPYLQR